MKRYANHRLISPGQFAWVLLITTVLTTSCVFFPNSTSESPIEPKSPQIEPTTVPAPLPTHTPECNPPWPTPPSEACPWLSSPTPTPTSSIPSPTPFEPPPPPAQTPTPLPLPEAADSARGTMYFAAFSAPGMPPEEPKLLYASIDEQGQLLDVPSPFTWTSADGTRMSVGRLSVSPSGAYLTSVYDTEGGESVVVVDLIAARKTAYIYGGQFFGWHPNGHELLFEQQTEANPGLWLVEASTGEYRLIAQPSALSYTNLSGAAVSPDGRVLAYCIGGIWMSNADGSEPQRVVDSAAAVFAWSPDGRYLLYGEYPHGGSKSGTPPPLPHLWLMNREGQSERSLNLTWELGITFAAHQQPAWSPTSQYVAHSSSLNPDFSYWEDKKKDPHDDPLYAFRHAGVYVEDIETGELWLAAENALDPTWSPDGSMLAIAKMDENDQVDIWIVDVGDRVLRRITDTPELDRHPIWLRPQR
jgi:Tol biopolymer transport system component